MKNSLLIVIVSSLLLLQFGCTDSENDLYEFNEDSQISDLKGNPMHDSVYYFPLEIFIDSVVLSNVTEVGIDTFKVEWFSRELHKLNEPVLYNYYLNKEIIRFTWLRSFDPAIIIRIEKLGDSIKIIEKKITEYQRMVNYKDNLYKTVTDSVVLEKYESSYSNELFNQLDSLIISNNYYSMPTTVRFHWGTDGSQWILETHSNNGYHVVDRWNGGSYNYHEICEFMIENSRFVKEKRY